MISVDDEILQWEDLKMLSIDVDENPVSGEIYTKVLKSESSGSIFELQVRFTLVPLEAYRIFREAAGSG